MGTSLTIRPARNTDSPGIIRVVERCFRDYEGCLLDVEGEEPGLLDPEGAFDRFWVLVGSGHEILGTIACCETRSALDGRQVLELKKLYLHPNARGGGWARRLVELVEDTARAAGLSAIELWSDTRFEKAHNVYEHFGYTKTTYQRALNDKSDTIEYHYVKLLG